ncbi:MAG: hypothetical protein IJ575_00735 [Selenomonadaceae bacterium]|nr:hypothetical protein [Selenomonadaceae bacterium]
MDDVKINSRKILSRRFLEGLRIAEQKFADEISREDALIQLYDLMRSFEEYDFHACDSKILKDFTDDPKLINAIYRNITKCYGIIINIISIMEISISILFDT